MRTDDTIAIRHPDRFYIGGEWVAPSSDDRIEVVDSTTEQVFLTVAEARAADIDRAITAARTTFDAGAWRRATHADRAVHLRALAEGLRSRAEDFGQFWPRESGVLHSAASTTSHGAASTFEYYAGLAETFP